MGVIGTNLVFPHCHLAGDGTEVTQAGLQYRLDLMREQTPWLRMSAPVLGGRQC